MPKARTVIPGISMKFPEYQAAPGCHYSVLKHMAVSPLHYRHILGEFNTQHTRDTTWQGIRPR